MTVGLHGIIEWEKRVVNFFLLLALEVSKTRLSFNSHKTDLWIRIWSWDEVLSGENENFCKIIGHPDTSKSKSFNTNCGYMSF